MTVLDLKRAIPDLSTHYHDDRLIPFIGSGFSKPLGLPTWEELIGSVSEKIDFESELFMSHGSFSQLAEYVKLTNRRIWQDWIHQMTVEFDSNESIEKRKKSIAHKALVSKKWQTIYTTNYDNHIEGALNDAGRKFVTLASLADFLEPRDSDACQVIKFHGTLKDPKTIVLIESNYFERMDLESAPDQRLRSDILSNSFMFIGYSFNDPNIRYVWYRIHKLRQTQFNPDEKEIELRPSYFVTFGANPVQQVLLDRWKINIVTLDPHNKTQSVAELLQEIK